ncbi:endogenous retrovirus group K member 18 Pol -like protein [Labeo rohita]|uniref:Endogenous retrovirus group K member 18 Pol-like protein n=1 Tax=Labeo rohita TaxID=84645 RepID=A0A498P2A7_LABRO|nr:endogenous retrovirus group K member 18 Pol -like protein [Labeo rohita]
MHFAALKKAITTAPTLGLPSFQKEFHLHVRETEGVAMGVLLQQHGSTYRPVAYLSKKLDNVAAGMPACLRAVSAAAIVVQMAEKIDEWCPMIVYTSHQVCIGSGEQDRRNVGRAEGTSPDVPSLLYLLIEIINKRVIQNVSSRYPTSLLRTVTFPVHQVLESASPPPRVQNTVDRIGRFPIYEPRRWGNWDRRINTSKKYRFDFRHMEHGMNPPVRWREIKADCHRTNDLGDRKRANEFGSKFIRNGSERNVLSRKPHFGTDDVYGRPRPVAIGLGLGARSHLDQSLTGSGPCATAPLDEGVSGGDRDFGFQTWKNWWLVSYTTFKWGKARGRYW